jgi:DNA-binding CsgD family transcriptional regulator
VDSFESYVEQTNRIETSEQLRAFFEHVMAREGFENFFNATIIAGKISLASWLKLPIGHLETYVAERWDLIDPVVPFMARATRPFCWDDVRPYVRLGSPQISLLDECKRVGIHSIIVAPSQHPDGSCDVVGISRLRPELPDPGRVRILQAICAQTWYRYAELTGHLVARQYEGIRLSNRELEVLNWIKDGKSNAEIAEIAGVSVKTVEFHVSNIMQKLRASNRISAVVIALRHGLVAL